MNLYEYNVLLEDGRVRTVLSEHCPDRYTGTYLRVVLNETLLQQGEKTPLKEFTFNVVL